ncbi:MAG TPA: hypothetical protein DCY07_06295, partial [Rhodospirillaceae bacterium]|nr:hypothetical protein [Rhodospirillaceae bacterium]
MSDALTHTLSLMAAIQKERGIALIDGAQQHRGSAPPFDEQAATTHDILKLAQKNNQDFWTLLPDRFFDA